MIHLPKKYQIYVTCCSYLSTCVIVIMFNGGEWPVYKCVDDLSAENGDVPFVSLQEGHNIYHNIYHHISL